MATFQESGLLLFGVGATITVVPMLVAVVVGRLVFKISLLDLLGTITGGMTSTPGLAAADSRVDSNIPVSYTHLNQLLNGEYGAWRSIGLHTEPADFVAVYVYEPVGESL